MLILISSSWDIKGQTMYLRTWLATLSEADASWMAQMHLETDEGNFVPLLFCHFLPLTILEFFLVALLSDWPCTFCYWIAILFYYFSPLSNIDLPALFRSSPYWQNFWFSLITTLPLFMSLSLLQLLRKGMGRGTGYQRERKTSFTVQQLPTCTLLPLVKEELSPIYQATEGQVCSEE